MTLIDHLKERGEVFLTLDKQRAVVLLHNSPIVEIWCSSAETWVFSLSVPVDFAPLLIDSLRQAHHRYKCKPAIDIRATK